jgi:hypothetical protein
MSSTHEDLRRDHAVARSTNRSFGLVMTVALCAVAFVPVLRGHPPRIWAAVIAAGFALTTAIAPRALEPLNRLWFRFGLLLGRITSPIFLAVFYYVVLTPLALLMRSTGKDVLRLRRDAKASSYWVVRTPPGPEPSSLRRQF